MLAAARTGAEWAWSRLYQDISPAMLGYLRARGAAEPEDVLGEVFLQVVRDLPSFSGNEKDFRAWAFTVCHHRLLDDARRRKRRPLDPVSDEVIQQSAPQGNAEVDALQSLGASKARAALDRLTDDQRDVLLLRILADLTIDEAARVLDKRPGAVKALQRRGLAQVRKRLEQEGVSL